MKGELLFRIIGEVDDDMIQNIQVCNLAKENGNKKDEYYNDTAKE